MSIKIFLIGALCLLATAEPEESSYPPLPEEDPTVSYLTFCKRYCPGPTTIEPTETTTETGPIINETTTTESRLVKNEKVCTTQCGVSRPMQRSIALLMKLINILGSQAKQQSLNVFVDVALDRFNESRYGDLTKSVAVILGNYEGTFAGALQYIVEGSYQYVNDSQTLEADDAFQVLFGVKYPVTTMRESAAQVLLVAIYAVYRMQNTGEAYKDLGNFQGNYSENLEVLVNLATATVTENESLRAKINSEQIESAFHGLTTGSFVINVNGEIITVTQNEFNEDKREDEGYDNIEQDDSADVEIGETGGSVSSTRARNHKDASQKSKSQEKNTRVHQKSKTHKQKSKEHNQRNKAKNIKKHRDEIRKQ